MNRWNKKMVTELMHITFYNTNFWRGLAPSHWTILGWVFVKCSYFLKPYCNYVFQVSLLSISKKDKDQCDFHEEIFLFYKFLEGSYFIIDNQSACSHKRFEILEFSKLFYIIIITTFYLVNVLNNWCRLSKMK